MKVCLFEGGGGTLISKLIQKTMGKKITILKTCGMHKKLIYINIKRFLEIRQ